jgi:3-dehydroquinate synthase
MKEIIVKLGDRSYPIVIEPGIFGQIGALLKQNKLTNDFYVITDNNVRPLYCEALHNSLQQAGLSAKTLSVPAGENSKSLDIANTLYTRLIEEGATRNTIIIALGGGVVGDLAGFVAATFLRGIRFVQIPTTLLSQVDSSVGGKVGINHALGKNLIGAFHQPELVVIDPMVLKTLPTREIKAGLAEVIKYSFILDYKFFEQLSCTLKEIINLSDLSLVQDIIATCCRIKADVVANDEKEAGLRAILNFGHTIGHALETVTDYQYFLHGEAVAHGMRGALYLSCLKHYINNEYLHRANSLIDLLEPPPVPAQITAKSIVQAMKKDKKRTDKGQLWVLLHNIGQYHITRDVDEKQIHQAIDYVLTGKQ